MSTTQTSRISRGSERPGLSRRMLVDKIARLSCIQQKEILSMIRRFRVPVSSNKNGHFFDLEDVPRECFLMISRFVEYSIDNQDHLDAYDRNIQEISQGASQSGGTSLRGHDTMPVGQTQGEPFEVNRASPVSASPIAAPAVPIKFLNCKKRFNKPPRNKRYDPDDVSSLLTAVDI